MIEISLYTEGGEFVTKALVPPFITGAPKIVFWGTRVFRLHNKTLREYREEFACAAFTAEQLTQPHD